MRIKRVPTTTTTRSSMERDRQQKLTKSKTSSSKKISKPSTSKSTEESKKKTKPVAKSSKEQQSTNLKSSADTNLPNSTKTNEKCKDQAATSSSVATASSSSGGSTTTDAGGSGQLKSKAINKMLKHLDIQISGFDKILPPEEKIITDLKSSISENVKTKYRAAAAVGKAITTTTTIKSSSATSETTSTKDDVQKDSKEKEKEPSLETTTSEGIGKIKPTKKKTKVNKPVIKKVKGITASAILVKTHKTVKTIKKLVTHKKKKEVITKDKEEQKDEGDPKKVVTRKVLPSLIVKQKAPAKRSRSAIADMLATSLSVSKKMSSQKRTPTPRSKSLEVAKKSKLCEDKGAEKTIEDPPAKGEPPDKKEKLPPEKEKPVAPIDKEKSVERQNNDEVCEVKKDNENPEEGKVKVVDKDTEKIKIPIEKEPSEQKEISKDNVVDGSAKKKTLKKKDPCAPKATLRKYNVVPKQYLKKLQEKKKTLPKLEKTKKIVEECSKKKDVYDFKSGSESEEEIKMELPTLTILKEYSDEDDKPLGLLTKPTVSETPSDEEKPLHEEKDATKVPKKEEKATVSLKKESKPPAKKTPKKEKIIISSSEDSSSSEEEIYIGPKRHRMASLNASAKVQCLYENESRTAQELGLSRTIVQIPKAQTIVDSEEDLKKALQKSIVPVKKESSDKDSSDVEIADMKRELRNVPGLRGAGKHWEFHDMSSLDSANDTDEENKKKIKKKKMLKLKAQKSEKEKEAKKMVEKSKKAEKKVKMVKIKESKIDQRKRLPLKKRKRPKKEDSSNESGVILGKKRIASLNATAIVAATYEVERHLDRNLATDCSSYESLLEEVKRDSNKHKDNIQQQQSSPKKIKQEKDIKTEIKEELKDASRPTSTSVVIVQDTDVTITGVYVNTATGSSQEAYCKMQYRVTEERVVRPNSSEPPKSYTPLSALSSMRPPGATDGNPQQVDPVGATNVDICIESSSSSYPHHMPEHSVIVPPPPPIHHYSHAPGHHYHHPQPIHPTPTCGGDYKGQYTSVAPSQPPSMPSTSISIADGRSSAFCAPGMQQPHHEISGYYQPAGPLISPHVLPPPPPPAGAVTASTTSAIDKKSNIVPIPLDSDPEHSTSVLQTTSQPTTERADSADSDVLITGGDLTAFRHSSATLATLSGATPSGSQPHHHDQPPPPQPIHHSVASTATSGTVVAQSSPYSRSMHQMHYPPAYPHNYYTPYPGDAMCYSPPYQPYFPAKVYPSSPAYRRFPSYYPPGHPPPHSELYETAPPPHPPQSSAQPPPTQSSSGPLVPTSHHSREHLEHAAGHSREHLVHAARHSRHAEHLEHYPGPPPAYYTSYSPAGAQCYPRTYMEYPPPPPCPCPMQQSCPKNAHTGPLIGSNSSNTGNNSQNTTIVNSSLSSPSITAPPTSAVTQSLNNTITTSATNTHGSNCNKTHNHTISSSSNNNSIMTSSIAITNNISNNGSPLENSSSVVVGINNNNNTTGKGSSNEKQLNTIRGPVKTINNNFDYEEAQYVNHIKAPCKLELDMTMATVPVKKEYIDVALDKDSQYEEDVVMPTTKTNALNNKIPEINTMIHTQIGRKARIGKTMAREMIHGNLTTAPVVVMKNSVAGLHDTSKTSQLVDLSKLTVKHIKQEEDIKKELNEEDDVVIVEDVSKKEPEIKVEPEIVDISGNVSTPPLVVINTDLSQDSSDVEITSYSPPQPKRIGILSCNNKPNTCTPKKSPNGYKSLIKQTEPKSYLVLSRKSDRKDRFGLLSKSKTVRRRKLVLTDQQKKRLKIQRKKRKALEKSKLAEEELKKENSKVVSSSSGRKSALDETIDFVARGYFSEPETSSPKALGRKAKKSKTNEARSKSESKKTTVSSESAKMLISNEQEIRRAKKSKETTNSPMEVVDITDSPTIHEDNNNCIRTNNNVDKPKPVFDDFKFIEPRVPPLRLTCSKRSRSRSKFGLKSKRSKRSKYLSAGIDEVIIPRRPDVVPKWNNGWTWEGEPFQRKIFLNSDEPYVVRTCYPAMRHQEGDVIRPRDCVLLKAGAKKNELPYVAKVAFLWENPTDGEMMMSLLWYYRPEHTEQGRMPIDASDEVFASKHRDHNSVACIEDKCYVLTYSEYCRYRRRLRAMEEDVDMNPSIVPSKRVPLAKPHHQVPVHTNPELVMFCQRVYEFRLKRLLKMPNT